jgi:hypothetical protein
MRSLLSKHITTFGMRCIFFSRFHSWFSATKKMFIVWRNNPTWYSVGAISTMHSFVFNASRFCCHTQSGCRIFWDNGRQNNKSLYVRKVINLQYYFNLLEGRKLRHTQMMTTGMARKRIQDFLKWKLVYVLIEFATPLAVWTSTTVSSGVTNVA